MAAKFEDMFVRFTAFAVKMGLGESALNQWELTYLDAFPKAEHWQNLADQSAFLPGLFGNSEHEETPAQIWSPLIDELLRIRTLKDDWDGEGTEAPHPALVDGAIAWLNTSKRRGFHPRIGSSRG